MRLLTVRISPRFFWGSLLCGLGVLFVGLALCAFPVLDAPFHRMRIESLALHFQEGGGYPCRLYEAACLGYGYAAPQFYGDLFLLPFVGLRLLGLSLTGCYAALQLAIGGLLFGVMWGCAGWFGLKGRERCIATCFWGFAPTTGMALFRYSHLGNVLAATFLPSILFPALVLFFEKEVSSRRLCQALLLLVVGLAATVVTHLISTVIALLFLCFLVLLRWRFLLGHRERLVGLSLGAVLCLGITAWFWLPLVEQRFGSDLWCFTREQALFVERYCHGWELFLPWNTLTTLLGKERLPAIPEDTIALWGWFLVPLLVLLIRKRKELRFRELPDWVRMFMLFVPITLLCLTVKPLLMVLEPLLGWMQFPTRFCPLLTCLAAPLVARFMMRTCGEGERRLLAVGVALGFVGACSFGIGAVIQCYLLGARGEIEARQRFDIGWYEYVPTRWAQQEDPDIRWVDFPSPESYGSYAAQYPGGTRIEVPRFYYKGYAATWEGAPCKVEESDRGLVAVQPPGHAAGELRVWYAGTPLQTVSCYLSLLFMPGLLYLVWRSVPSRGTNF